MDNTKKPSKQIIINLCLLALMLIAIIANIVLWATPVFHGTYKAKLSSGEVVKLKFYDNTYTLIQESQGTYTSNSAGFFTYTPAEKYKDVSYENTNIRGVITLTSTSSYNANTYFYKKSVFKITSDANHNSQNFYCGTAIFLQVLYPLILVISLTILIRFNYHKKEKATT